MTPRVILYTPPFGRGILNNLGKVVKEFVNIVKIEENIMEEKDNKGKEESKLWRRNKVGISKKKDGPGGNDSAVEIDQDLKKADFAKET